EASTGCSSTSRSRHCPIASKFSSGNPAGSIVRWQLAHAALLRCAAKRSRIDKFAAITLSSSAGTFGGGGGGGAPSTLLNTNTPRSTGDVRVAYDVTDNTLPCRNNPPRLLSGASVT